MSDIIPVKVRTARKQHVCAGYPCRTPILPGDLYEDVRQPPGNYDWGSYDHWVVLKFHAPQRGACPDGCEIAAAYGENAERGARQEAAA